MDDARHDLFISHASEDKESVARPLCDALTARGWTVWLDELELTIGDSLSGRIDAALVRSRFGIVVLSEAFFGKEWPTRELAGLTAREVAAGSKVILPVWHGVDETFLVQRSPTLADRLAANTNVGIEDVAAKITSALRRADERAADAQGRESAVELPEAGPFAGLRFDRGVPTTDAERRRLIEAKPPCWETILYAGYLLLGRERLNAKWNDHELSVPRGPRNDFDDPGPVLDFTRREVAWLRSQISTRISPFNGPALIRAFGQRGEGADPDRIAHFATHVINTYELMMDWAASVRNITAPESCADLIELTARMTELQLHQIRDYIDRCVSEMARVPTLERESAESGTAIQVSLMLELSTDPRVIDALPAALERIEADLSSP